MRLGRHTNGISCEYDMQDKLKEWLEAQKVRSARFGVTILFDDEVTVHEVARRADFLVLHDGRLINIEAKCNDYACLMQQLKDHSIYCDYSFAFIPDYSLTPQWFKNELAASGFGLIVYNYDSCEITEVFEAHHNKPKDKTLKRRHIQLLKASAKKETERQNKLNF